MTSSFKKPGLSFFISFSELAQKIRLTDSHPHPSLGLSSLTFPRARPVPVEGRASALHVHSCSREAASPLAAITRLWSPEAKFSEGKHTFGGRLPRRRRWMRKAGTVPSLSLLSLHELQWTKEKGQQMHQHK